MGKGLTQECLRECAPADAVDTACAKHRACTVASGRLDNCDLGYRCACDAELLTAVSAAHCSGGGGCKAAQAELLGQFNEGRACWGADYACQMAPCTTAPTGFCKQCGYFKKCHSRGAPTFTD